VLAAGRHLVAPHPGVPRVVGPCNRGYFAHLLAFRSDLRPARRDSSSIARPGGRWSPDRSQSCPECPWEQMGQL
jgi:hypothetical protein